MKYIYFFMILLFGSNVIAQNPPCNYIFPDSNAVWIVQQDFKEFPTNTEIYFIQGDTVINNNTWSKLYFYIAGSMPDTTYYGAIRQDTTCKVYYHGPLYSCLSAPVDEYLLYNFSLHTGDTLILPNCYTDTTFRVIQSVDSVLIHSNYRKRYTVSGGMLLGYDHWIEGIGGRGGPVSPYLGEFENNYRLCYFIDSGDTSAALSNGCFPLAVAAYMPQDIIRIYPNPASGSIYIEFDRQHLYHSIKLMDINGRVIYSTVEKGEKSPIDLKDLPAGIYIVDVKSEEQRLVSKFVKM